MRSRLSANRPKRSVVALLERSTELRRPSRLSETPETCRRNCTNVSRRFLISALVVPFVLFGCALIYATKPVHTLLIRDTDIARPAKGASQPATDVGALANIT